SGPDLRLAVRRTGSDSRPDRWLGYFHGHHSPADAQLGHLPEPDPGRVQPDPHSPARRFAAPVSRAPAGVGPALPGIGSLRIPAPDGADPAIPAAAQYADGSGRLALPAAHPPRRPLRGGV